MQSRNIKQKSQWVVTALRAVQVDVHGNQLKQKTVIYYGIYFKGNQLKRRKFFIMAYVSNWQKSLG